MVWYGAVCYGMVWHRLRPVRACLTHLRVDAPERCRQISDVPMGSHQHAGDAIAAHRAGLRGGAVPLAVPWRGALLYQLQPVPLLDRPHQRARCPGGARAAPGIRHHRRVRSHDPVSRVQAGGGPWPSPLRCRSVEYPIHPSTRCRPKANLLPLATSCASSRQEIRMLPNAFLGATGEPPPYGDADDNHLRVHGI